MEQPIKLEFQINPIRLNYLLDLYKFTKTDFLKQLQGNLKNQPLNLDELNEILDNKRKVNISILNKLDNLFEKGIEWYISRRTLPAREKLNLFFRKDSFNATLNLGSIKKIEEFERKKNEIETFCDNIGYKANKPFDFTLKDNPEIVAKKVRIQFEKARVRLKQDSFLKKTNSDRDFLENLIRTIEEFNVFVFEFTETWNKKDKVNFNGFFISPNMIVIKRQQNYFKREIFTLMHEFAHYLLNEEEVDDVVGEYQTQGVIENWCNEFAYNFLIGDFNETINELTEATPSNDYHQKLLQQISKNTCLSTLSLYTRLKIINKISVKSYNKIHKDIVDSITTEIQNRKDANKLENQIIKERGGKPFGSSPKPIESKLFKEIVRINYFEGNISEGKVLESLKIKNKSFEEVIYS